MISSPLRLEEPYLQEEFDFERDFELATCVPTRMCFLAPLRDHEVVVLNLTQRRKGAKNDMTGLDWS